MTLDYDSWEEVDDLLDPQSADPQRLHRQLEGGPRNLATLLFYINDDGGAGDAPPDPSDVPERWYTPGRPEDTAAAVPDEAAASDAPGPYVPGPKKEVTVMTYDMGDFFKDCVKLYAELTDTEESTYPRSGAPFGPELTSFEDGQGGPRGELIPPAEEALAECLRLDAATGPPDREIPMGGPPPRRPRCP